MDSPWPGSFKGEQSEPVVEIPQGGDDRAGREWRLRVAAVVPGRRRLVPPVVPGRRRLVPPVVSPGGRPTRSVLAAPLSLGTSRRRPAAVVEDVVGGNGVRHGGQQGVVGRREWGGHPQQLPHVVVGAAAGVKVATRPVHHRPAEHAVRRRRRQWARQRAIQRLQRAHTRLELRERVHACRVPRTRLAVHRRQSEGVQIASGAGNVVCRAMAARVIQPGVGLAGRRAVGARDCGHDG